MVDRVLDPQYLEGLDELPDADLQQRIQEAMDVERQTSADRRALHRIIEELQREAASRG